MQAESDKEPYDRVYVLGSFRCFFRMDGSKAAPAELMDSDNDGVPDFIVQQTASLLNAHRVLTEVAGLPDFFVEGSFARQGMKYIDIVLDDIPVQLGLASTEVANTSPSFLRGSQYDAPSITIRLHRALPSSSLTPAHELFRIFQYACLPFLNMWFMEGTACHGQRWLSSTEPKSAPLPQTEEQLEYLLRQWHDAEPFWNRLGELCDPAVLQLNKSVAALNQIGANPHLAGQRFLPVFFRHGMLHVQAMRNEMPRRNLPEDGIWPIWERRSGANNRYILRAICDAVHEISGIAK